MNRFFLDPKSINGKTIHFPEDISHQILHVLRLKEGSQVEVLDNDGLVHLVRLEISADSKVVNGQLLSSTQADTEPAVAINLYFGMTNREKMEWILQKGTEIGVSSFMPFISSRTLVRKTDFNAKRQTRWEKIIREAAEQSRRGKLPVLHSPQEFLNCLSDADNQNQLSLIAWEGTNPFDDHLQKALSSFAGNAISLFVGPEGGFSEEEINQARTTGCKVVSLGLRILRMETAAIIFPALVLFALDQQCLGCK